MKNESILDKPQVDLDMTVWKKTDDGKYVLNEEAYTKIMSAVNSIIQNFGFNSYGVNMTGSLTSNQYSPDSDVDIHINATEITKENSDEMNKRLREFFATYKSQNPDKIFVGKHPIEVYFQHNVFQDMMSVGCYDVLKNEWIVGPEKKELSFDPYSEYYQEDMKYVSKIISGIRNVILECYETSLAINSSDDEDFKRVQFEILKDKLSKSANLFQKAKEFRKVYSSPKSKEDALSKRSSRKWKIADSAFKLMDKLGYLRILKTFTTCYERLMNGEEISQDNLIDTIIEVIDDSLKNNKNLTEDEKYIMENNLDESLMSSISKYALIASVLTSPLYFSQTALAKDVQNMTKPVAVEIERDMKKQKFGGMSYQNNCTMIAWTLWTEARNQVRKYGWHSLDSIASVMLNRAGGDPQNYVSVISKPLAFSWWNDYNIKWNDSSFESFKKNVIDKELEKELKKTGKEGENIWLQCNELATKLLDGEFESTIGNLNSYLNKAVVAKKNPKVVGPNGWGTLMKDQIKVGDHTFGYLPENDGFRKERAKNRNTTNITKTSTDNTNQKSDVEYKVKRGDNLEKIAKKYKTTVASILKKNPSIKDKNKISINQKIKV